MKLFYKKIKRKLYKFIMMFLLAVSLIQNPVLQDEIRKMMWHFNEVRQEQMEEVEKDDEADEEA